MEKAVTKIRNCSENVVLALVYYFYQMVADMEDFEAHEECQDLYNALVNKLDLGKHADGVLEALVSRLEKSKKLVSMRGAADFRHPFNYRGSLKKNFREDGQIYDCCGRWDTRTERNINMCRYIFSSGKNNMARLIALTFFTKPGSITEMNSSNLSRRISVPVKFKKAALEDTSSVHFLAETLKLNKDEEKLLQIIFRLQSIKEMYMVANDLFRSDELTRMDIYSRCSGKSQKEIRMLLKSDQKLVSYGLIDSEGSMDEDAIDSVVGQDMRTYFSDIVKPEKNGKTYSLDSFSVSKEQTDVAVQLLKSPNPVNLLVYGAPGAGKTEFVKALIKQAGLKTVTYKNELEISGDEKEDGEIKALRRLNCYLSMKKSDSVLVVDEAENVLQTKEFGFFGMQFSSPMKGTVNNMLSNSENKCVYIVNYTTQMDESTLRRFTYSIKFNPMPKETLRSIAAEKLKSVKMPSSLKNEILSMTEKYKVTGASVDNVVKAISSLNYQKGSEEKVMTDIRAVLEANSTLLYGRKKIRDGVNKSYDLSVLNTSLSAPEMVEMLQAAEIYKKENPENKDGVRCLFYGLSGTGKTELARYVSEVLGKPLLIKRCSDIIDPFVGRTEQNIAQAFEEAESSGSILLFDEADSFFSDRNGARQNFERTMVNEFLTQMEEFSGICICTTNLRKIMDPAMLRRFHIVSEFKALNREGINTLLKSFFGKYRFEEEQIQKLTDFSSVTPGDFGSLNGKMRFVPKERINSEYIINELVRIQNEKRMNIGGQIGFAS